MIKNSAEYDKNGAESLKFCEKRVRRAVREAERYMKGKVDADNLIRYIQSKGYSIVFYNSKEEHPLLKKFELVDYAKDYYAFTFTELPSRYVFVDEELNYFEMRRQLAHEAGHVALGHLEGVYMRNTTLEECEAELFSYLLLHCPRKRFIRVICSAISKIHSLIKDYYIELKGALTE